MGVITGGVNEAFEGRRMSCQIGLAPYVGCQIRLQVARGKMEMECGWSDDETHAAGGFEDPSSHRLLPQLGHGSESSADLGRDSCRRLVYWPQQAGVAG